MTHQKEGKVERSSVNSCFFTESGMLRIRWWPVIPPTLYILYNVTVFLAILAGAKGVADPVWNAPIFWLFGH